MTTSYFVFIVMRMARDMMSFRIEGGLRDALVARALAENRSVSNMVEVLLEAALTERGAAEHLLPIPSGRPTGTGADHENAGAGSPDKAASSGKRAPRSVSPADTIRVEHTVSPIAPKAPEPPSVPPKVHDVPMREVAKDLASRNGKCVADTPRGTKCKLCGKVH